MRPRSTTKVQSAITARPLMVRLDEESKQCLIQAANLRHISVSDYLQIVTIPQARREIRAAQEQVVTLTSEEQLSFWGGLERISQG